MLLSPLFSAIDALLLDYCPTLLRVIRYYAFFAACRRVVSLPLSLFTNIDVIRFASILRCRCYFSFFRC